MTSSNKIKFICHSVSFAQDFRLYVINEIDPRHSCSEAKHLFLIKTVIRNYYKALYMHSVTVIIATFDTFPSDLIVNILSF